MVGVGNSVGIGGIVNELNSRVRIRVLRQRGSSAKVIEMVGETYDKSESFSSESASTNRVEIRDNENRDDRSRFRSSLVQVLRHHCDRTSVSDGK